MDKQLIIVCNGGSIKDFDWESIDRKKYDVMITGLSFRFFNRIKFNPDLYINVDKVCLKMIENNLCSLIKRDSIKRLCISGEICYTNDVIKIIQKRQHKVDILETMIKDDKLPFYEFKNITTGASAILYAMTLGYRDIKIIGLDNDYVECIIESKDIGEGKREITSDVKNNPNYFFNDYQREGDVYNKPNNIPNLHSHAIKEVMEKKILMEDKYKVEINITNYNDKESVREFIDTKPLSELFI
mgnify:FL=1